MSRRNRGGAKTVCKGCRIPVSDIRRHEQRGRCAIQHLHPNRVVK